MCIVIEFVELNESKVFLGMKDILAQVKGVQALTGRFLQDNI